MRNNLRCSRYPCNGTPIKDNYSLAKYTGARIGSVVKLRKARSILNGLISDKEDKRDAYDLLNRLYLQQEGYKIVTQLGICGHDNVHTSQLKRLPQYDRYWSKICEKVNVPILDLVCEIKKQFPKIEEHVTEVVGITGSIIPAVITGKFEPNDVDIVLDNGMCSDLDIMTGYNAEYFDGIKITVNGHEFDLFAGSVILFHLAPVRAMFTLDGKCHGTDEFVRSIKSKVCERIIPMHVHARYSILEVIEKYRARGFNMDLVYAQLGNYIPFLVSTGYPRELAEMIQARI